MYTQNRNSLQTTPTDLCHTFKPESYANFSQIVINFAVHVNHEHDEILGRLETYFEHHLLIPERDVQELNWTPGETSILQSPKPAWPTSPLALQIMPLIREPPFNSFGVIGLVYGSSLSGLMRTYFDLNL